MYRIAQENRSRRFVTERKSILPAGAVPENKVVFFFCFQGFVWRIGPINLHASVQRLVKQTAKVRQVIASFSYHQQVNRLFRRWCCFCHKFNSLTVTSDYKTQSIAGAAEIDRRKLLVNPFWEPCGLGKQSKRG